MEADFFNLEETLSFDDTYTTAPSTDISHRDAVVALQQLNQTMQALVKVADMRMSRIESNVCQILDVVSKSRTISWPNDEDAMVDNCGSPFDTVSTTPSDSSARRAPTPSSLALKIVGLDTRWYTKRPMAPFQIQLVDDLDNIFHDSEGYTVIVHLVSGHGVVVDQYLANSDTLTFPVIEGRADISSLRFLAVSSRNGGHFRLQFCASGPSEVASVESEEIEILSERLKNEHKAESILDLSPDDALVRVPGIGKKYAQKLSQQGLQTIRDLASIDTSPEARTRRLDILNAVRRDRGALTEAKLVEMLRDAKAVVKREKAAFEKPEKYASDMDFPVAKKQRIEVIEKTVPMVLPGDFPTFDVASLMNTAPCLDNELDSAYML